MYALVILFFTLPLYFSHVFAPFGLVIGGGFSFERQKIYLFLILLSFAYIEGLLRFPGSIGKIYKKYVYFLCVLIVLPIGSVFYFERSIDIDFWIGSHEKHHGYLFYCGIITFILLLLASPTAHLKKYISWSLFSSVGVACIAIGESSGGILDIYGRSEMLSMYPGRSSSTLGNPNYVAGYLLPFIPIAIHNIYLLKDIYSKQFLAFIGQIVILGLLLGGIYVTGSYITIFLVGLLLVWYAIRYVFHGVSVWKQSLIFLLCIGIIFSSTFYALDPIKLLSLESRFILMKETFLFLSQYPVSFFIGFGPDAILSYFSEMRSSLIDAYFPSKMLIDSSHNIMLDVIFQYGILPIFLILSFLFREKRKIFSSGGLSIILMLLFLSLNVFVIIHIIMLSLMIVNLARIPERNPYS